MALEVLVATIEPILKKYDLKLYKNQISVMVKENFCLFILAFQFFNRINK